MVEAIIAALILLNSIWLLVLAHRISNTLDRSYDLSDQRIDRLKAEVIEGRHHTERSDAREQSDREAIIALEGQMNDRPRRRTDRAGPDP